MRPPPLALVIVTACGEPAALDAPEAIGEDAWAPVADALAQAYATQTLGLDGMSLTVWNSEDEVVFSRELGAMRRDRRVAVASATKLVTALVLLRLVHQDDLSLTETTGTRLGWTGDGGDISLDALGAFVSGLSPEASCTRRPGLSLMECVAAIASESLDHPTGARFDYGSTHLHVAAGMAVAATGEAWNDIVTTRLAQPLGLTDRGLRTYTFPKQRIGTSNPLAAGGMSATVDEYARFLSLILHDGQRNGQVIIAPALIERLFTDAYADAIVGESPAADMGLPYRYGFGTWLECEPGPTCDRVSSAGAYGFTPWVDREHRYYAILAMESDGLGGAGFSFPLEQALQPLIESALEP